MVESDRFLKALLDQSSEPASRVISKAGDKHIKLQQHTDIQLDFKARAYSVADKVRFPK